MTTTATERTTVESLADLPVGTLIENNDNGRRWRKTADDEFTLERGRTDRTDTFSTGSTTRPRHNLAGPDHYSIVESALTVNGLRSLPVGTVVENVANGRRWRREDGGLRMTRQRTDSEPAAFALGHFACLDNFSEIGGGDYRIVPAFTVGQYITTREEIEGVPVGTVIQFNGSGSRYVRVEGGYTSEETANRFADGEGYFVGGNYMIASLPDADASLTRPRIEVGTVVNSAQVRDSLPIGSVLKPNPDHPNILNTDDRWEVLADEFCLVGADGRRHPLRTMRINGYLMVESLPRTWAVGDHPETRYDLESLPVGTTIGTSRNDRYTKLPDGRFQSEQVAGARHRAGMFTDEAGNVAGVYTIMALPGSESSEEAEQEPAVPPFEGVRIEAKGETLPQYQQRFRTTVWGFRDRHGVSASPLESGLSALQVFEPRPTVGMRVCANDSRLLRALPDGSLVLFGDLSQTEGFSVWRTRGASLNSKVLGGLADVDLKVGTLLSGGRLGTDGWVDEEPTAAHEESILAFQRQAWTLGHTAKVDNEWCAQFERAMAHLGISAEIENYDHSDLVTAEQVSILPVGTYIRFALGEATVLLKRVAHATNPAGTVRVAGNVPGDWAQAHMRVVHLPTQSEPLRIASLSLEERAEMPTGTRLSFPNESVNYTKQDDGTWHRVSYGNNFPNEQLQFAYIYTSIPD